MIAVGPRASAARRRRRADRVVVRRDGPDFVVNGVRETFPRTYGECLERYPDGVCPWFRCKMHNAIEVDERSGAIGTNNGRVMTKAPRRYARAVKSREPLVGVKADPEVWERRARELVRDTIEADRPTCALFLSRRSAVEHGDDPEGAFVPLRTLEEMGDIMNVTRERARQIEVKAMRDVVVELEEIGVDLGNVQAVVKALGPDEHGLAMLVVEALKFRAHERSVVAVRETRRLLAQVAQAAPAESMVVFAAAALCAVARSMAVQP